MKIFRPFRTSNRTLFGQFQRRAERNRRHRRHIFNLCSIRPHVLSNLNVPPRHYAALSTYVLITPPQLSWLNNPIGMLRCFVRKASLLLCRVQLRCCENLFPNQMLGPPTLRSCELSVRKKVSLSVEKSTSSRASLWGNQWMWCRLWLCSEG